LSIASKFFVSQHIIYSHIFEPIKEETETETQRELKEERIMALRRIHTRDLGFRFSSFYYRALGGGTWGQFGKQAGTSALSIPLWDEDKGQVESQHLAGK
jgi:hypothetical protein